LYGEYIFYDDVDAQTSFSCKNIKVFEKKFCSLSHTTKDREKYTENLWVGKNCMEKMVEKRNFSSRVLQKWSFFIPFLPHSHSTFKTSSSHIQQPTFSNSLYSYIIYNLIHREKKAST
jgi:hypothetical protein